ncbi:hypothetical protein CRG98_000580 [Punica granatum]|uniref:Retroviral polymerase SH3-like domain-containing protein n=1 Tax=Punica granatum TaxID=22663 RepID=A0A2I0LED1_PUNGR|nr:hypothetical protein CRG98_000580 [Punica granatum]
MRTAVDLINLTPSVALDGDVPQQVWTDKEVSYRHLRVFECRASVHIRRDERSKLDAKAKQCIFLGYAYEEFRYKFWDPDSMKIIRSRDVMFFEDPTIEDLQKLENAILSSPHEISIPVPVDVEHRVEEVPAKYEETMTGGEISQVDDDVIEDDTGTQLQSEPANNIHRSDRAINEKMNSLSKNHTYDLVKLPQEVHRYTDPNVNSCRGPHARDLKSRGLTDCSTFPWGRVTDTHEKESPLIILRPEGRGRISYPSLGVMFAGVQLVGSLGCTVYPRARPSPEMKAINKHASKANGSSLNPLSISPAKSPSYMDPNVDSCRGPHARDLKSRDLTDCSTFPWGRVTDTREK